jgi:zinc/manganese transport system substrate-binding protein
MENGSSNMKPRTSLGALTLLCVLCAAAPAWAELRIVTTTADLASMARAIGRDRVVVDSICHGRQDPHFVQARPSYMVTLSRADLLISVGLELEAGWLPALLQGARNPAVNPGRRGHLEAASVITPIDVPRGPVDRSRGDIHPLGNPHFWLDPQNAKRVAQAIGERMIALDPENAGFFRENLGSWTARIDRGLARWTRAMSPYRGTQIASYHATFNYFHARFGLQGIGYLEDRPGIPPAPAHLMDLIRLMRASHVRVIFHETYYDRATSDLVATRTGAKVLVLPTSVGGAAGASNYDRLIDLIVSQFVAAMSGQASP